MGDAGFFTLFASGRLGGLLPGWTLAPAGIVLAPRESMLSPLCHSGMHLGHLEPLVARSLKKTKHENDLELKWEPFETHFRTFAF